MYSDAKKSETAVENFKKLLDRAVEEHRGTSRGMVEEINGDNTIPDNVSEDIISSGADLA